MSEKFYYYTLKIDGYEINIFRPLDEHGDLKKPYNFFIDQVGKIPTSYLENISFSDEDCKTCADHIILKALEGIYRIATYESNNMNSEVLRIMSAILEDFLKGKALMNEIRSEDISDKIFDQGYAILFDINDFLTIINNRKIKQINDKLDEISKDDYIDAIDDDIDDDFEQYYHDIDDDDDFGDLPKINRLNY